MGVVIVAILMLCGVTFMGRSLMVARLESAKPSSFQSSPQLNPVEAIALETYLSISAQSLDQTQSSSPDSIIFTIAPGESAAAVSENLAAAKLIGDQQVFRAYLRYYGLDTRLEAGEYLISNDLTIPQVAAVLTDPELREITVRIPEGWRREQIADWIDSQTDFPFSGQDFLTATDRSTYSSDAPQIVQEIPQGVTLEGWLFPDTYRITLEAKPNDLVYKALGNLESKITPEMRNAMLARSMTLYQVLTLASIVEREAVINEERPLIASVYLNRLALNMMLEADPTVQYALGYQPESGDWWKLDLTVDHYQSVVSPYNTYLNFGLPPGPIANPSLASIDAVIFPAESPFLFFRAKCDGSGQHYFSESYEEHLTYACP